MGSAPLLTGSCDFVQSDGFYLCAPRSFVPRINTLLSVLSRFPKLDESRLCTSTCTIGSRDGAECGL